MAKVEDLVVVLVRVVVEALEAALAKVVILEVEQAVVLEEGLAKVEVLAVAPVVVLEVASEEDLAKVVDLEEE